MVKLIEATKKDLNLIVKFLKEMAEDTQEFGFDEKITAKSVEASFDEMVHWFLFYDDNNKPFGTCYCQHLHNYWRLEKRFYLGGFYITPNLRGKGNFELLNKQFKEWVIQHNGVQIYGHVHEDNQRSLKACAKIGLKEIEYKLCVNHWGD
jgi:RimJ/RimL family protein N-acetyltransferase